MKNEYIKLVEMANKKPSKGSIVKVVMPDGTYDDFEGVVTDISRKGGSQAYQVTLTAPNGNEIEDRWFEPDKIVVIEK